MNGVVWKLLIAILKNPDILELLRQLLVGLGDANRQSLVQAIEAADKE